eukprot:1933812-Rhodomonas_salina.1
MRPGGVWELSHCKVQSLAGALTYSHRFKIKHTKTHSRFNCRQIVFFPLCDSWVWANVCRYTAIPGEKLVYGAMQCLVLIACVWPSANRHDALVAGISLCKPYVMPGTDTACGAICLRPRYAMLGTDTGCCATCLRPDRIPGTDIGYGAFRLRTRCPVLPERM